MARAASTATYKRKMKQDKQRTVVCERAPLDLPFLSVAYKREQRTIAMQESTQIRLRRQQRAYARIRSSSDTSAHAFFVDRDLHAWSLDADR